MNLGTPSPMRSVPLRKREDIQRRQCQSDLMDTKPGGETLFTGRGLGHSLSAFQRSQHWWRPDFGLLASKLEA